MFSKTIRTLLGVLFIPVAIGTTQSFIDTMSGIGLLSGALRLFERGVLAYLAFHVIIIRPVYLYVLGHESVHVLATWVCGGKVISFNVTPRGGNVVTSKTNFFIELSPYFVPIYTILLGPFFLVLKAIGYKIPFMSSVFLFFVGVTMAFHFAMTSEALRIEQPDIVKSGMLFSLILILVCNLVIIIGVFTPFFSNISFMDFLKGAFTGSKELYILIYERIVEFVNNVNL